MLFFRKYEDWYFTKIQDIAITLTFAAHKLIQIR